MKIEELIEILEDHDPQSEVKIAMNPARPFVSHIRGVVHPSLNSAVFLVEDYNAQPSQINFWGLLDEQTCWPIQESEVYLPSVHVQVPTTGEAIAFLSYKRTTVHGRTIDELILSSTRRCFVHDPRSVARLLLLPVSSHSRRCFEGGEQMIKFILGFLATVLVLITIYLGMWIGCALDDECFEMHTGYSAKDPKYARP